jgi:hypothetical protein
MTENGLNRSTEMELMHEAMARAQVRVRLDEARERRRSAVLARAHRLVERAERRSVRARVLLARSL